MIKKTLLAFISIISLCAFSVALVRAEQPSQEGGDSPPTSYLGIGNSFTWNSTKFLAEIVASQDEELDLFVAGIGGSSLEEHMKRVRISETDPDNPKGRPYQYPQHGDDAQSLTLLEVLQKKDWDYVSIQQLSRLSFRPETYEPHAGELVSYLRKHSPKSEIVVHMTWAYREDHDWFISGERTQEEMYQGLADAYQKLADTYGLKIIPIGAAMQQARKMKPWQFSYPDPDFNYNSPVYPEIPHQPGSLNTGWRWREDRRTGEMAFGKDANHANDIGCYLGGLVHFEFFFGRPVKKTTVFRLDELNEKQLDSLVKAAHQAIVSYRPHNRQASKLTPAQP